MTDTPTPQRTDPTIDIRFLTELARRADAGGATERISAADICDDLGVPVGEDTDNLVERLRNRGLITVTEAPRRMGETQRNLDIRPTAAGYQVVGNGLLPE